MSKQLHLFIAALSGRSLVQAAREAGLACTVADCFGDADTQALAAQWFDANDANAKGLSIDAQALRAALQVCADKHAGVQLVVITGSGFEANLSALKALENTAHEVGAQCAFNSADVMQKLLDPLRLFEAVRASGAQHPRTQMQAPFDANGWLVKQVGGQGAMHVKPAEYAKNAGIYLAGKPIYYQEEIIGCERSLCFSAQYSSVVSLGFNLQDIDRTADGGFCYRGAIGGDAVAASLPKSMREQLLASLSQLCGEFGLRGLGSLDFIVSEGRAYILEINARPTASFELYDTKQALLHHLAAFGVVGLSLSSNSTRMPCTAHRYVFAPQAFTWTEQYAQSIVKAGIAIHITDWPQVGMRIPEGTPLCNLHASGASIEAVQSELLKLEQQLCALIVNTPVVWKEAA